MPTLKLPSLETAGLVAALMDAGLAAVLMFGAIDRWAPPQDLFWKPLSLARPLGSATPLQLARAAADPALCRATLRQGGVRFVEVPPRRSGQCVLEDVIQITGGTTALVPVGPAMTCRLALSYALWERQVVRPQARRLGAQVAGIEHFGTYACRNIYNRPEAGRSQHASANALDVAGFKLAGGRRITVIEDFASKSADGRFLHRVRDGACQVFGTTLSPDYNAAHRNHLYLDGSAFKLCS